MSLGILKWLGSSLSYAGDLSLHCMQGRVGVGLRELAALLEFVARLTDPTLTLPYFAGEG
jgi:hypothetical protein